ncbi:hypothetical protein CEXT_472101 [Caerostris extrusa]|uniref:Uncharacterized protein n=1 Tax=Caerostris extrusa TaxID=172846 RepID=A0AAV4XQW8_CAEEX|nr:hypothetical protein CEXT_472101 [Caerostris extrusa]
MLTIQCNSEGTMEDVAKLHQHFVITTVNKYLQEWQEELYTLSNSPKQRFSTYGISLLGYDMMFYDRNMDIL